MLRELGGEMLCGPFAYGNGPKSGAHWRRRPWDVYRQLTAAVHLAGEARTRRRSARDIEHVELVFARDFQALESFADYDEATRAGQLATAIMRDVDAVLRQPIEESFVVFEVQLDTCHIFKDSGRPPKFKMPLPASLPLRRFNWTRRCGGRRSRRSYDHESPAAKGSSNA